MKKTISIFIFCILLSSYCFAFSTNSTDYKIELGSINYHSSHQTSASYKTDININEGLQSSHNSLDYNTQLGTLFSIESLCGNNLKEFSEVCDGSDLSGESCVTQNYTRGTLGCSATCGSFDLSGCILKIDYTTTDMPLIPPDLLGTFLVELKNWIIW